MNKKKELYSSIFFIVVSIMYFIGATSIKSYNAFGEVGINSSTIPKILGGLLFVLSIVNLINSIISYRKTNETDIDEDKEMSIFDQSIKAEEELEESMTENKRATVLTFVFLIIFALFLEPLGFIIMSIFFLISQMTLLTPKNIRKKRLPSISIISLIFSVLVYVLFTKGFSLILPAGIIG